MSKLFLEKLTIEHKQYDYSKSCVIDTFYAGLSEKIVLENRDFYKNYMTDKCGVFRESINKQLNENNIHVAELHGLSGITPQRAIVQNRDDVVYEISDNDFMALAPKIRKALVENCNLLICDYMEGGDFCRENDLYSFLENIPYKPKAIFLHTNNYNFTKFRKQNIWLLNPTDTHALHVSSFASSMHAYGALQEKFIDVLKLKATKGYFNDFFIMCRKPRYHRVKILADIRRRGLLHRSRWTLAYPDPNKPQMPRVWNHSPDIHELQNEINVLNDENINRFYQTEVLPKLPFENPKIHLMQCIRPFFNLSPLVKHAMGIERHIRKVDPNTQRPLGVLTANTWHPMLIGLPTLVVSAPGAKRHLDNMGFKTIDFDYPYFDNLEGQEKIKAATEIAIMVGSRNIADSHYSNEYLADISIHNFKLMMNKDFMASLLTNSLIDMHKYLNA